LVDATGDHRDVSVVCDQMADLMKSENSDVMMADLKVWMVAFPFSHSLL
jgi:hypothetical protein